MEANNWTRHLQVTVGVAIAIASLSIGGIQVHAAELKKITVGESAVTISFTPIAIGKALGIWQEEGIEPVLSSLRGDAQVHQALSGGNIQIGVGSGPGIGFLAKGVPARAIAVISNEPTDMMIAVSEKSGVKSVKDLEGKRIGVSTQGSLTDWLTKQIGIQQGWGPNGVKSVSLGDLKSMMAALETNSISGFVHSVEMGYASESAGKARVLQDFGGTVKHFHTHVIFARLDMIERDPDGLRRFLRGWFRAQAYMQSHPKESAKIAAKAMNVDEAATERAMMMYVPAISHDGDFADEALNTLASSFVEMGILEQKPNMGNLLDRSFVPLRR